LALGVAGSSPVVS